MGYIGQLLGHGFSSDIDFKIVAVFPSSFNEDFKIIIICLLIPARFRRDYFEEELCHILKYCGAVTTFTTIILFLKK